MNYFHWSGLAWNLHMLFIITLFLGVVFLIIWAIKSMDKKTLKKWTVWLLLVGILGSLLTASFTFQGMKYMKGDYWAEKKMYMMDKWGKDEFPAKWDEFMKGEMEESMGFEAT